MRLRIYIAATAAIVLLVPVGARGADASRAEGPVLTSKRAKVAIWAEEKTARIDSCRRKGPRLIRCAVTSFALVMRQDQDPATGEYGPWYAVSRTPFPCVVKVGLKGGKWNCSLTPSGPSEPIAN